MPVVVVLFILSFVFVAKKKRNSLAFGRLCDKDARLLWVIIDTKKKWRFCKTVATQPEANCTTPTIYQKKICVQNPSSDRRFVETTKNNNKKKPPFIHSALIRLQLDN